jgi:hypothetical protein
LGDRIFKNGGGAMKDEKAIKHLNKLGKYCMDRTLCEGCVFRNIRHENKCPIALALELTEKLRKGEK